MNPSSPGGALRLAVQGGLAVLLLYSLIDTGGHDIRSKTVAVVVTVLLLLISCAREPLRFPSFSDPMFPLALFCIFGLLVSFLSVSLHDSLLQWVLWISYAGVFILVRRVVTSLEEIRLLSLWVLFCGCVVSAVGVFFYVLQMKAGPVMSSTFFQKDVFAGFILLLLPFSIVIFLTTRTVAAEVLGTASCSVLFSCLLLTGSRGALLALLLVAPAMLLFSTARAWKPDRGRMLIKLGIVVLILAGLLAGAANRGMTTSLFRAPSRHLQDSNIKARLSFWKASLELTARSPLVGTGFDTFGRVYPEVQKDPFHYSRYPHSFYLQLAQEAGIPGILLFLWFLFCVGKAAYGTISPRPPPNLPPEGGGRRGDEDRNGTFPVSPAILGGGLGLSILAGLLHMAVDVDHQFPGFCLFLWTELGLLVSLNDLVKAKPRPPAARRLSALQAPVMWLAGAGLCAVMISLYGASVEHGQAIQERGQGNLEKALLSADRAVKLDPLNGQYFKTRAQVLAMSAQKQKDQELWDKAEASAREAVRLDPKKAYYYQVLGKIKVYRGRGARDREEARDLFNQALRQDPLNYPGARSDLGALSLAEGKLDEAKSHFQKVLEILPEDRLSDTPLRVPEFKAEIANAWAGLGDVAIVEKDQDRAISCYREALRNNPRQLEAQHNLGMVLFSRKEYRPALEHYAAAFGITGNPVLIHYMGLCLLDLGEVDRGEQFLKEGLRLKSDFLPSLRRLALLSEKRHDSTRAKAYWQKILALDPKNKEARKRLGK